MSNKLISIIISSYNDRENLKECLISLHNQTSKNFEIIVVDASSIDGTTEMIRKHFPDVQLIEESKISVNKATNIGLLKAKGDYIAFFINTDEIVDRNWLEELLSVIEEDSKIGVVGGVRYVYGKNIIESYGGKINYFMGSTPLIKSYQDKSKDVDWLPVIMINRNLLKKIGILDESYGFYYGEPDICLRVKRAGYRIVCVPNAIQRHHGSTSIGKFSQRYYYYLRSDQIRFVIKNFPIPYLLISLIWLLIIRTLIDSFVTMPFANNLTSILFPNTIWTSLDKNHLRIQLNIIKWVLIKREELFVTRFFSY